MTSEGAGTRDYLRSASRANIFQWLFQREFKLLKLELQLGTPSLADKLLSQLVTWNLDMSLRDQNVLNIAQWL